MYVCDTQGGMCYGVHVKIRGQLKGVSNLPSIMGPRVQTQIIKHGNKVSSPTELFASPLTSFLATDIS